MSEQTNKPVKRPSNSLITIPVPSSHRRKLIVLPYENKVDVRVEAQPTPSSLDVLPDEALECIIKFLGYKSDSTFYLCSTFKQLTRIRKKVMSDTFDKIKGDYKDNYSTGFASPDKCMTPYIVSTKRNEDIYLKRLKNSKRRLTFTDN
ncbi:hypothetical protein WA158_002871 [Blastocystis sp. Blastoise]